MTTGGGKDAAGNEGTAPGVSGTSGAQGKKKPVSETAEKKWDIGKYEGAGATSDAPMGTYTGTPTSASGGIPATGEGEMSTGNMGASTGGTNPATGTTGAGVPAGTGPNPGSGTPAGPAGEQPMGTNAGPVGTGEGSEMTGLGGKVENGRRIGAGTPTPAGPAEPNQSEDPDTAGQSQKGKQTRV